jgi:tetratricopeptide (TPR) repeat protein
VGYETVSAVFSFFDLGGHFRDAIFAQKNFNCFSSSMPPMDVMAACDQNIASDPNDAQVYQARGIAWYRMGDYDRAIADLTQSIKFDPKYIRAFYNRGLAWEKKGRVRDLARTVGHEQTPAYYDQVVGNVRLVE